MIGERIRALRKAQNKTQQELARDAEMSQGHLSDIENGRIEHPQYDALAKIARSLEVPVAALLPDDGSTTHSLEWLWLKRFSLAKPSELLTLRQHASFRVAWSVRQLLESYPLAEVAAILKLPEAELPRVAEGLVEATPALIDILVENAEVPKNWLVFGEPPPSDPLIRKVLTHRYASGYLKAVEKAIDNRILPQLLDSQIEVLISARQSENPSGT